MTFPIYPNGHPLHFSDAREWRGHVSAGRLGSVPTQTAAQKIRHAKNELAVLGELK